MRTRRQTSGFPRVNCLVPDCRRGTTTIRPNAEGEQGEYVCAVHWRTVPKDWKQRLSLFIRRMKKARGEDNDVDLQRSARAYWRCWTRIRKYLTKPDQFVGAAGMPLALEQELTRSGIL